jgi:hypothetical protein
MGNTQVTINSDPTHWFALRAMIMRNALGSYLSGWNETYDYFDILEALQEDNADKMDMMDISVWEPFQDHTTEYVAELIESQYDSLRDFARAVITMSQPHT